MTAHFTNLQQFFHMGGYGFYVWSAYGFALFIIVFNVIKAKRAQQKILKEIQSESSA